MSLPGTRTKMSKFSEDGQIVQSMGTTYVRGQEDESMFQGLLMYH